MLNISHIHWIIERCCIFNRIFIFLIFQQIFPTIIPPATASSIKGNITGDIWWVLSLVFFSFLLLFGIGRSVDVLVSVVDVLVMVEDEVEVVEEVVDVTVAVVEEVVELVVEPLLKKWVDVSVSVVDVSVPRG